MTNVILLLSMLFLFDGCAVEQNIKPLFPCSKKMENQYGVCSHVTRKDFDWGIRGEEIPLIAKSGARVIRSDYDFRPINENFKFDWLDSVSYDLKKNNMEFLGIISRPWKSAPWKKWGEYQKYMSAYVDRYGKVTRYWEIINEIDLTLKHEDSLDVKYSEFLKVAYNTIKSSNPNNKVLLSGIAKINDGLLEKLCKQNAFEYFDIMNFHSYNKPEDFPVHFDYIKMCMDKYGWKKPVWITELGSPTCTFKTKWRTEDYQARTVARFHLISFAYGIDKVFWYNFRSFEKDDKDPESHFGLTHKDLSPKPGLYAYQTLTRLCPSGSTRPTLWKRGDLYMSSWKRPDRKRVWAIWVGKGTEKIEVEIKGKSEIYDYLGKKIDNVSSATTGVTYIVGAKNVTIK